VVILLFSSLEVVMEAPCFNNNQQTWQKRAFGIQVKKDFAPGCIFILQADRSPTKLKAPAIFD
jgi:hypothetical protein